MSGSSELGRENFLFYMYNNLHQAKGSLYLGLAVCMLNFGEWHHNPSLTKSEAWDSL